MDPVLRKQDDIERWKMIISEANMYDGTINDYCSSHDISRHAYYYWNKKLKALRNETHDNSNSNDDREFFEVSNDLLISKESDSKIIIQYPCFNILINKDFDAGIEKAFALTINHHIKLFCPINV